jgi:hypothetical protein
VNLAQRAISIVTQPRPEWQRIDAEPASTAGLFSSYAVILALLPLVGTVLAGFLFGGPLGFTFFLLSAIIGYVVSLGVLFLMIIITNAVAPNFGGVRNEAAAAKLLIFSATPMWLAGLLNFIPGINFLVLLVGFALAAYLLYVGSTIVMKVPADRAGGFTGVVIAIWVVISFVLMAILTGVVLTAVLGTAAMSGAGSLMMR